jgi:hypothetical protein
MHDILSKQTHTISPTNLHDLLTLATNGDVRARMVYASHILVGTYIDHPVVQAFTKEILSREFKDLAPERYLPPPDQ